MNAESPRQEVTPGKRVALVLGAGGARGIAHVGVIQALEARGYQVAGIAGASMGALVGGIYAAGRLKEYTDWACALERTDVLRLLDFVYGYPGLIRGDRVIAALRELVGDHLIEDLPIPYTAVATDLASQREVWLTRGKLFDAIRASIAIPMVFTPAQFEGRELVDGGLLAPVPIAATRQMRVDRVIAVDVNGPAPWANPALAPRAEEAEAGHGEEEEAPEPGGDAPDGLRERMASIWDSITASVTPARTGKHKSRGVMDLMSRSLDTMQAHMSRVQLAQDPPDLLIQLSRESATFYEFWRARELVERGRAAAEKALDAAGL
ncbi:patatin-like phospholipase family protein [Arenimonas caeni]|jgi:NTE family protein|uniref:patatin-like phospholipase family protein n=1 Tax=Arenimonas caeni TaxID=2058085 RepID=UPI002A36ECE2|nr:patatin-like phospholipase family protein [Arenimonas caeni]MDY0021446.1 patatin-like phospholipase family protein [Arenimonas caeni]